jgi:methionyl-tRNA formyltransferase
MKIVYWGSPESSALIAKSLLEENFNIVLIITQPDRKKGRGKKLLPTPVKKLAISKKLPVLTPQNPNNDETIESIRSYKPDLFFLCAYAKILNKQLLELPKKGAVNLHFSLLPKLRGAAPIHRAIMEGYTETGVTTFFMNEFIDRGEIIAQKSTKINRFETAGELEKRLIPYGNEIAKETIKKIDKGDLKTTKQDASQKSYAKKISKEERIIDWNLSSAEIIRKINGLSPRPGSFTFYRKKRITLLKATGGSEKKRGEPGELIPDKQLGIIAGDNKVVIIELLKPEGKKTISSSDFINGYRVKQGDRFYKTQ